MTFFYYKENRYFIQIFKKDEIIFISSENQRIGYLCQQ